MLLELIEGPKIRLDVLGDRAGHERLILPFVSGRRQTEDPKMSGVSESVWDSLCACASM